MTDRTLTAPQLRALLWLAADGSWQTTPRSVAAAVASLQLHHGDLVMQEWGWRLKRTPFDRSHYRLTRAGIAEQARRREVGK